MMYVSPMQGCDCIAQVDGYQSLIEFIIAKDRYIRSIAKPIMAALRHTNEAHSAPGSKPGSKGELREFIQGTPQRNYDRSEW